MSAPSRSRSLRQPGYTRRELIADGPSTGITEKHDLKPDRPEGGSEAQGHSRTDDSLPRSNDGCQASSGRAETATYKGNERSLRVPPTLRGCTVIPQQLRPHAYQQSGKAGQNGDMSTDSCSSRLPFPSQLARSSSSQRRPISVVNRRETSRIAHSRNASTAGILPPLSKASQVQPQGKALETADFVSPPAHVSTVPKPAAARGRSRSNQIQEHRRRKSSPNAENRLTSVPKPQFAAYQQQFSPKRQKPPLGAPKTCSRSSDEIADDHQFGALQDELLQLQLMYLSADKTLQNWTETGERRSTEQQKKYLEEACNVSRIEQAQQVCINGVALRNWLAMDSGKSSLEKVESLAYCIETLTDLARPQQKLCRVIEQFESWSEHTTDAVVESSGTFRENDLYLIQPLGRKWNEARMALTHSFELCLRSLQALGAADESSGLGLVLGTHTRFVKNVLDELNTMGVIHAMALDRQDAWIRGRISDLVEKGGERELLPGSLKHDAAWDQVR